MKILGLKRDIVKQLIREGRVTIAVYGLGHVGLPLAALLADKGAHVIGVDVKNEIVNAVNSGENPIEEEPGLGELIVKNVREGRLEATTNGVEAARRADVHIITVPVLVDQYGNIDLKALIDAAENICRGLEKGDTVVTETTLPPGTTESLQTIFDKSGLKLGDYGLAHAPERIMTGTAIRDMTVQYPKIIGASDEKTLEAVAGIYESINTRGVIAVSSIRAAEAVKVFEGVYRYVNIALANELALWAEENGLDVLEIIKTANTQPYCHIHMPGAGVGGHCIPVYPWFIVRTFKTRKAKLLETAREINDYMPHHMVKLTIKALNMAGRPVMNSNILILGLSYRGNVKGVYKSPAPVIARELREEWGARVFVYDPYFTPEEVEKMGFTWKRDFKDIDAIVIVTDHKEFKNLNLEKIAKEVKTRIIVDGRHVINPHEALKHGFIFLGVGRTYPERLEY